MISKYSFVSNTDNLRLSYGIDKDHKGIYSYHIHPHKLAPILTQQHPNKLELCHWGLIPHWSKTDNNRLNLINADVNGLSAKISFRLPFRQARCIIPADSFYAHIKGQGNHRFLLHNRSDLAIAGLYDDWSSKGNKVRSYAMLTKRTQGGLMGIIPNIPVILEQKDIRTWLNPATSLNDLIELLQVSKENLLKYFAVTPQIDDLAFDHPSLHVETKKEQTLFS